MTTHVTGIINMIKYEYSYAYVIIIKFMFIHCK
jgi:hypothetical protein